MVPRPISALMCAGSSPFSAATCAARWNAAAALAGSVSAFAAPDDLERGAQLVGAPVAFGERDSPRRQCSGAGWVAGAKGGVGGDRCCRRVVGSVGSFSAAGGDLPSTVSEGGTGEGQTQFGVLVAARRPQRGFAEFGGLTGVPGQGQNTHPIGDHAGECRIEDHRPRQVLVGASQGACGSSAPGEGSQQPGRSAVVAAQFVEISGEQGVIAEAPPLEHDRGASGQDCLVRRVHQRQHRVPRQRVHPLNAARATVGLEEVVVVSSAQRLEHQRLREGRRRAQQSPVDVAPDHRRRGKHPSGVGIELGETPRDQAGHGRWHGRGRRAGHGPTGAVGYEHAGVDEPDEQLLDEQGEAVGVLDDVARHVAGNGPAETTGGDPFDIGIVQPRHRRRRDAVVTAETSEGIAEGLTGPRRAHDEYG